MAINANQLMSCFLFQSLKKEFNGISTYRKFLTFTSYTSLKFLWCYKRSVKFTILLHIYIRLWLSQTKSTERHMFTYCEVRSVNMLIHKLSGFFYEGFSSCHNMKRCTNFLKFCVCVLGSWHHGKQTQQYYTERTI